MLVIPAINCKDFECVQARLRQIVDFGAPWVHFDISNGTFAQARTWDAPETLASGHLPSTPNVEVHLMVGEPETRARAWAEAGARRIIVHVECVDRTALEAIVERLPEEVELGLGVSPETPLDAIEPFLDIISFVQCLAVMPGFSGQQIQSDIVERVRELRQYAPHVTIEVDGGITPETARHVLEAGADIVVSASYIFEHAEPQEAYRELRAVS